MKFEIKHRFNSPILFSIETDSWKLAMEAAVNSSANLRYADLSYANLRYADLRSADLRSANLSSAIGLERFPISIFGHKHALCTHPDGRLAVGCEVHSFEEWEEQVQQIGEDNDYSELDIEIYKLHIAHIAKTARLLWKDKYPVATKKVAAD